MRPAVDRLNLERINVMKHCLNWIVGGVVVVGALYFLLPMLGVPIAGASAAIPLLLVACCVIPMVMTVVMSNRQTANDAKGCCGGKKAEDSLVPGPATGKSATKGSSCH